MLACSLSTMKLKAKTEEQRKVRANLLKADDEKSKDEEVAAKEEEKAVRSNEDDEEKKAENDKESKDKGKLPEASVHADDDVSMSQDYEATVQAAMEADLLRRAKERKARKVRSLVLWLLFS